MLTEGGRVEGQLALDHFEVKIEQEHELIFIEDGGIFMKVGGVHQVFEEVGVKLRGCRNMRRRSLR